MLIRSVFMAALLLVLAGAGWSFWQSGALQGWLNPRDGRRPTIVFDNGSVRQPAAASDAAAVPIKAPGGFRKCRKGQTVVYTDRICPEGTREEALANGTVTVLPAQKPPLPAKAPGDTMDLREKRIERIVNQ